MKSFKANSVPESLEDPICLADAILESQSFLGIILNSETKENDRIIKIVRHHYKEELKHREAIELAR
jgi:hypothetical protein